MRTIDDIYGELVSGFVQSGATAPVSGSDMDLRLKTVAAQLFTLEAQTDYLSRQSFPQTATGDALDRHAALRGLSRVEAQTAVGALTFYREQSASSLILSKNTQCLTTAGAVFRTTAAGRFAAGVTECTVPAEAMESGSAGNVPAGSVVFMKLAPTGVTAVLNLVPFTGGRDPESDDELRARVLNSYRTLPNGANAAYYENKVRTLEFVDAVTVVPRARGVGTVDIFFSVHGGQPNAEQVSAVQALLDAEREISVDLRVSAPSVKSVDVSATLLCASGYSFDQVRDAATDALTNYFDGSKLSCPVYRASLDALFMAVPGVENCSMKLPSADISAESGVLPVLGKITLNEAL